IFLDRAHCRRGIGRALYAALLPLLRRQGYVTAAGGITLPNPASVALHESLGFRQAALYPHVGFKHGAWRDVGWWTLQLTTPPAAPPEPIPWPELAGSLHALLPSQA